MCGITWQHRPRLTHTHPSSELHAEEKEGGLVQGEARVHSAGSREHHDDETEDPSHLKVRVTVRVTVRVIVRVR